MMDDFDRIEEQQPDSLNERAQNRFSQLKQEALDEAKRHAERKPKGKKYKIWAGVIFGLLVVPLAIYTNIVLPIQTDCFMAKLPYTKPEEISKFANTKSLCKVELYTDSKSISPKGEIAFGELRELVKRTIYRKGHSTVIAQSSDSLLLHSPNKSIDVRVAADALDSSSMHILFQTSGDKLSDAPICKEWLNYAHDDPDATYQIIGLPTSQKVCVVGLVEKENNTLWMRKFAFKHLPRSVIVEY